MREWSRQKRRVYVRIYNIIQNSCIPLQTTLVLIYRIEFRDVRNVVGVVGRPE